MFKVGDKVILKDYSGIYSLELNKIYIIEKVTEDFVIITDRFGDLNWYSPERFELYIKQERKEKLQKLCSKATI